ncbi:ATPase, T2SS/T4P/T4SS family [Mesorhizobium sp. CAU 1732]|uniref:ATPase, T2SS/T4P/T4SS family n=1 Tax=Mesorhizobium sp. CAU 1732 TaxID=3140358 RepID=UPI003260F621
MARLLKSTMRLRPRPDCRRGGPRRRRAHAHQEWNTGHPGGLTTIHANNAKSALRRLEQLTPEVSQQPMREVIGEAIDLVVSIERTPPGHGRIVRDIVDVERFADGEHQIERVIQEE